MQLLLSILTIIIFRTLPGLNKILNEIILANYGNSELNKIETKLNYVIYTRITVVILLLTALVSGQVLGIPEIEEGFSICIGLLQETQKSSNFFKYLAASMIACVCMPNVRYRMLAKESLMLSYNSSKFGIVI